MDEGHGDAVAFVFWSDSRAELLGCYGLDRGEAAAAAAVNKLDAATDLGEERIVGADAYVDAGLDAGTALAHDDGAAGNELAAKGFYAQALCIGFASVCGAASTLFMCHFKIPF